MSNDAFAQHWADKGLKARYSRYEYEGTEYERRHINHVLPMDDAVWDNYLEHTKELAKVQDEAYDIIRRAKGSGLSTAYICCTDEIYKPENEIRVEWLETEEEWIERCKQLDADAK